jgi:RNA polymerase sigma-70 factor (ECF subfamily)
MLSENDAEILGRSLDEPGEFAAIYNRHVGSILRYARRRLGETAGEDVVTLLLVVWGELTYEEAAAAVGVPVGTVRSRISRARRQLRQDIPEPANTTNDRTGEAHA